MLRTLGLGLAFSVGATAAVLGSSRLGQLRCVQDRRLWRGPIETSNYSNPHATITVKGADKTWTVTLAPTSRMQSRGAPAELVAVGKTVRGGRLRSRVEKDEMRAERITVDGKTVEMR